MLQEEASGWYVVRSCCLRLAAMLLAYRMCATSIRRYHTVHHNIITTLYTGRRGGVRQTPTLSPLRHGYMPLPLPFPISNLHTLKI